MVSDSKNVQVNSGYDYILLTERLVLARGSLSTSITLN